MKRLNNKRSSMLSRQGHAGSLPSRLRSCFWQGLLPRALAVNVAIPRSRTIFVFGLVPPLFRSIGLDLVVN
jgi:hypothetical protein